MIFKKIVSVTIILTIVLCIFSACQNKNEDKVTDENEITETTEEKTYDKSSFLDSTPVQYNLPLTDEPITLTICICESWTPQFSLADNREVFKSIENDTGIKLKWEVIPREEYDIVIKAKIATGEIPDIMGITGAVNPIHLYKDGLTIDHGKYISEYAPNILKIIKENEAVRYMMMGADNTVYTATVDMQYRMSNVKGLYYRKDWQKKLGIKDPQTLKDYYNMFRAFAENDPNGNGEKDEVALFPKEIQNWGPLATAFGLDFQVNTGANSGFSMITGELTYQFARPEYKEFLEYLKSYYDAGLIPMEVFGDINTEDVLLKENRLGAYYNGLGQCNSYDNVLLNYGYIDSSDKDNGYYWLCPPQNSEGEHISSPMVYVQDNEFVISKKCKHPELAIKWLDYVWASEKGRLYTCYGIEGKSYTLENGKPVFTDYILANPDGLGVHPALRTLGAFVPWLTNWSDEAFAAQWADNIKMTSIINEAKDTFKYDPLPIILGTPEESEEISAIQVELDTYTQEMMLKFITGHESLDNFDNYVNTLYSKYRLQELIDIKNSQLQSYKTTSKTNH